MRIYIAAPTYKKNNVTTHKIYPSCVYWCGEENLQYLDRVPTDNIHVCEENGLCGVRNQILEYAIAEHYDFVMITDDDIKRQTHCVFTSVNGKRTQERNHTAIENLTECCKLADELGACFFGFNSSNSGLVFTKDAIASCRWVSGDSQIFNLKRHVPVARYDKNVTLRDDLDMTVQMIKETGRVLNFRILGHKKDIQISANKIKGTNGGGCSCYRTREREMADGERLMQKHGSIVKWGKNKAFNTIDNNAIVGNFWKI